MAPDEVLGRTLREVETARQRLETAGREYDRLRQKLIAAGREAESDDFRCENLAIYSEVLNMDALRTAAQDVARAQRTYTDAQRRHDDAKR
jgi:hypothetical protein